MMKMREVDSKDWFQVAYEEFKDVQEDVWIGADPNLLPLGSMKNRKKFWEEKKSKIGWKLLDENLVDKLWEGQPQWPEDHLQIHDEFKFTGRTVEQNIKEIMTKVEEKKGEAIIITPLDEIAWLTNLRGKDIEYNPVFFSYAIIHKEGDEYVISLYVNPKKVTLLTDYLAQKKIRVFPYEQIFEDVKTKFKDLKFVIDENEINTKLYQSLTEANLINVADLVGEIKMVKNATQINGMKASQIRDGVALL